MIEGIKVLKIGYPNDATDWVAARTPYEAQVYYFNATGIVDDECPPLVECDLAQLIRFDDGTSYTLRYILEEHVLRLGNTFPVTILSAE